jgi:N-methylhydantoinase B
MALNAVGTIVKAFMDPGTPINHGSFLPIEVINPPGTFINAREPAPCGGMVEVKAALDSTVVAALGQALPERMVGELKGGANHVLVSGPMPDGDGIYILYEYPAGGTGASAGRDGNHAVRTYTEGDFASVQSVEVVESQFPLRVERCELRQGCCGDGEFRGGLGLRRDVRLLEGEASLSVLTDRAVIPPAGVVRGMDGVVNRFVVLRDGAVVEPSPIPGKVAGFGLNEGDVVRMESAGGGGYGDPLARQPERVLADVARGYISASQADARYGVVLDADGAVDAGATKVRRRELADGRIHATLEPANEEMFDGARRRVLVPGSLAARLGIADGELIELIGGRCAAPVRAWASVSEGGDGDAVRLGPSAFALLGAAAGEVAELRVVRPVPVL